MESRGILSRLNNSVCLRERLAAILGRQLELPLRIKRSLIQKIKGMNRLDPMGCWSLIHAPSRCF